MKDNKAWTCYWQDNHLNSDIAASQQQDRQVLENLWKDFAKDAKQDDYLLDLVTDSVYILQECSARFKYGWHGLCQYHSY